MRNFKILLCIPPDYDWNFPPLGTAALTGYLKLKGNISVEQQDYNIEYRNFLLEKTSIGNNISGAIKKRILRSLLKKYFAEELKNKYYYKFIPHKDNFPFLTLPYDNNTNSSFFFTEKLLSSDILYRYITDEEENTFLLFFKEKDIISNIAKKDLGLLGISITSPSQVIPSLTLAHLIKKNCPDIHITAGGQWVSLYRNEIITHNFFGDFFDTLIYFEGETPLGYLVDALKNKKDLEKAPNLIYKKNKRFYTCPIQTEENLDMLPCPDFDGLPLSEYSVNRESKGLALTFETSRGCYWGRCAFCVDLPLPKLRYRRKDPTLVIRDMKELVKKYKPKELLFSDPALSPIQMRDISKLILKENINISWWTMARLDNGFNKKIFGFAKKAGCEAISFGLESASERVCEQLDKGNKKDISLRVINDCHSAGVLVNLQVMLGLPAECFQDGLETIEFLCQIREKVNHVCFNEYYLTPANYIYENPKKYDIEFTKDRALPFKFFNEFIRMNGLNSSQVELLKGIYNYLCNKKEYNKGKIDLSKTLNINSSLVLSEAVFKLNGGQAKIQYLTSTGPENDFIILDEVEQNILSLINEKTLTTRDIIKMVCGDNSTDMPKTESVLSSINNLFGSGIIKMI